MSKFRYGVACSLNDVSTTAPITLRGPIEQLCKEAKEIGYDGLEIQLANPRQYDWNHIKTVCNDSGLELITFATGRELGENGLCLLSDDASVRRASIDRLKEHNDLLILLRHLHPAALGQERSRIHPVRDSHIDDGAVSSRSVGAIHLHGADAVSFHLDFLLIEAIVILFGLILQVKLIGRFRQGRQRLNLRCIGGRGLGRRGCRSGCLRGRFISR